MPILPLWRSSAVLRHAIGRNTVGGRPRRENETHLGEPVGKVRVGYGEYDNYWYDGVLNFGVTDNLAVKLSAARNNLRDGYYENIALGRDEGAIDYQSYGFNALWNATDDFELEYTYTNEETDQDTPPLLNVGQPDQLFCSAFELCAPSVSLPTTGDRYKTSRVIYQPTTWTQCILCPTG